MNSERLEEIREIMRAQFGHDLAPFEVYAVELLAAVDNLRAKLAEAEKESLMWRNNHRYAIDDLIVTKKRLADAELGAAWYRRWLDDIKSDAFDILNSGKLPPELESAVLGIRVVAENALLSECGKAKQEELDS